MYNYITPYLDPNCLTPHTEEFSLNFPCLETTVNPVRSFNIPTHIIFAECVMHLRRHDYALSSMLANFITFDCAVENAFSLYAP